MGPTPQGEAGPGQAQEVLWIEIAGITGVVLLIFNVFTPLKVVACTRGPE